MSTANQIDHVAYWYKKEEFREVFYMIDPVQMRNVYSFVKIKYMAKINIQSQMGKNKHTIKANNFYNPKIGPE